jgi:MarR family transcriptional regulator, organic hydroperoxide resistance regulator
VTDRPRLDFSDYLPYLINRVGLALVVGFGQDTLSQYGLSIAMWRVLAVLSNHDGQRQIDLAAKTSIDVSTLSRVVGRLVKMGLVSRTRSATNSREVVVQLTAKGVAILARVIPRAIAAEQTAIAGVSARDLAVVRRSLRRMYENLASSRVSERSEARLRGSAAAAVLSRPRRAGGRIRR